MDQKEFTKMIHPFRDKIYRLARRLLVSAEEAEDATQEVYIKLWNKNEDLRQYQSVEALAMTMTKNYCLDQLKSKRSSNLSIAHSNYRDHQPSVSKIVEDRDSLSWVEKAIESLPEQQRMIIQLREVEQYEYAEIAEILNMNETAVRVALSRARKIIREMSTKTHAYGIA